MKIGLWNYVLPGLICLVSVFSRQEPGQRRYYSSPFLPSNPTPRIIREDYSYNNELQGPSFYFYNDIGFLTRKVFVRTDGYRATTTFEYTSEGRLKNSVRVLHDGRRMVFSYTYNDHGEMISRISSIGDSVTSKETYIYDKAGLLEAAVYLNADGWLTGRLQFTSTKENGLHNGTYQGEDGIKAKLSFIYNQQGLIKKIRWDFSNEKFQEYTFQYEAE